MSSYGILWGFVGYIRLMTRCGNGRIRGKPHGADAPPQPNGQKIMDKTITLTSDDICIITIALLDKAMNIKNSAKICGITLSSQTLNKLASMQELVNKIND